MYISDEVRKQLSELMKNPSITKIETGRIDGSMEEWIEIELFLSRTYYGSLGSFVGAADTVMTLRTTDGYGFPLFLNAIQNFCDMSNALAQTMKDYLERTKDARGVVRTASREEYEVKGKEATKLLNDERAAYDQKLHEIEVKYGIK